jgi:hypothetical protein
LSGENDYADAKALGARTVTIHEVIEKGVKEVLKVASAGTAFLKEHAFTLHIVTEGHTQGELTTAQSALRAIGARHGVEIENTVPKVMRSKPFGPVRGMLGRDGERWVPIHAVFPLSRQEVVAAMTPISPRRVHGTAWHRLFGDVDDGRRGIFPRARLLLARRDHAAALTGLGETSCILEGPAGQCRGAQAVAELLAQHAGTLLRLRRRELAGRARLPVPPVLAPQTWRCSNRQILDRRD